MRTYKVDKSAIVEVGWQPATGILEIRFDSQDLYRSCRPVEGELVAALLFSRSPSRFFMRHLHGLYGFEKIQDHRPVVGPAQCVPCPDCQTEIRPDCPTCLGLRMIRATPELQPQSA